MPDDAPALEGAALRPPVPRPSKIVAIGLNYHGHAEESGLELPAEPVVFTKLPSALSAPTDDIVIPGGPHPASTGRSSSSSDRPARPRIAEADAWSYVAGVTGGQDVSDREEQFRALRQFAMAKSFDTYAPLGPVLVTPDELADPDDVGLTCRIDGEVMQSSRTGDLIFPVPALLAWTSRVCTLEPGDLIFTGTPSGVGYGRDRGGSWRRASWSSRRSRASARCATSARPGPPTPEASQGTSRPRRRGVPAPQLAPLGREPRASGGRASRRAARRDRRPPPAPREPRGR